MIFRKKYTDAELIAGLKSDDKQVRVFERYLFEDFKSLVRQGQKRYHLKESDSLDCYMDAFTALVKTVRTGGFSEGRGIAPLFKTIFDRKCVDQIRRITNSKNKGTDAIDDLLEMGSGAKSALEELITTDFMDKIRPLVQKLGDNCRNIIYLWSHGYAHKEIAATLPTVSNDKSSKAILNKCLKKIRQQVHFS